MSGWTIVIHGGAGAMRRGELPANLEQGARDGLAAALDAGAAVLRGGGTALDAVEAAVRPMEDDPCFNAGRGATFTADGTIELDAAIMDGGDRRAGAVAGLTRTRSPIGAARAVMEHSPHAFLQGPGADRFSREMALEQAEPGWFRTEHRWRQLQDMSSGFDAEVKFGTVGAVARDASGHVAAATSTGGLTGKRWGRVGDTPVIGAGTYADDRAGAVSATGSGEFYIRTGAAHEICAQVRLAGLDIVDAADRVQAEIREMGGLGGVIVVGREGDGGWSFTTAGMYRARASEHGERRVAVFGDEG